MLVLGALRGGGQHEHAFVSGARVDLGAEDAADGLMDVCAEGAVGCKFCLHSGVVFEFARWVEVNRGMEGEDVCDGLFVEIGDEGGFVFD